MDKETAYIYDTESYPNFWLICAKNPFTGQRYKFEISETIDERIPFVIWLRDKVGNMIGYNNLFYDDPVISYLVTKCMNLRGSKVTAALFKFGDKRINSKGFFQQKESLRRQHDLLKINHFDNKAKMTSLKLLEFNLKLNNIRELPHPVGTFLTREQQLEVIDYCHNDCDATEKLFHKTLPAIELREILTPKYGIDFTNFNDVKVGEHIFISKIIAKGGQHLVYDLVEKESGGTRKVVRNTKRESIDIGSIILPFISFREEPFKRIESWFKSKVITEIAGVFGGLPMEAIQPLVPYTYIKTSKKGIPLREQSLNIIYKGFQYKFGVGGIHGSITSGVYTPTEKTLIIDIDVAGYYPSMSVLYKFEPEHLKGVYSEVHAEIKDERSMYAKKTAENLSLKLAGNGTYGKGGSEFSPLCDTQYVVQTCVNGQLLLCMLAETLTIELTNHRMLQINTDGMTIEIRKDELDLFRSICRRWEALTGLILEEAFYDKMIIANVNNYIAVKPDGYVKRKGDAFIYKAEPGELELHKDFSSLIIAKALEAYFVYGKPVEEFIRSHTDYHDFCKRTKINKSDKLLERISNQQGMIIGESEQQRINRYVISGEAVPNKETKLIDYHGTGVTLIKQMPPLQKTLDSYKKKALDANPDLDLVELDRDAKLSCIRYLNVEKGWLCTSINQMIPDEEIRELIYYPHYIGETLKIINAIENHEEIDTSKSDETDI